MADEKKEPLKKVEYTDKDLKKMDQHGKEFVKSLNKEAT
jgi:hypothetical protein